MRTINCTVVTIAEALRAAGTQVVVRSLIVAGANRMNPRGLYAGSLAGRLQRALAHVALRLRLPVPVLQPAPVAMHREMFGEPDCSGRRCVGRLDRSAKSWRRDGHSGGLPGGVSLG